MVGPRFREALRCLLIPSKVCTEFQRNSNASRCMSAIYIPHNPPLKSTQGRERSPENSSERYAPLASILPRSTATNTSQRENVPVPSLPLQPLPSPNRPSQTVRKESKTPRAKLKKRLKNTERRKTTNSKNSRRRCDAPVSPIITQE